MNTEVINGDKYSIVAAGRQLPGGGKVEDSYYGPAWLIIKADESARPINEVVVIPDPGDGSAEPLARKILSLLNSEFR